LERPLLMLVYSLRDPASRGAAQELLGMIRGKECSIPRALYCAYSEELGSYIAGFDEDTIRLDFLDDVAPRETQGYVVLSRHSGGKPSLTVHYTGNPGPEARYGGRPWELSYTWPRLHAALIRAYRVVAEEKGLTEEFQVVLEATHHGPTSLKKPLVFIEIGSSEKEWVRRDAHRAMAETLYRVLTSSWESTECTRVAIGVGDTHYPSTHTRGVLEKKYCYTHIFAKYALANLNTELLDQAKDKSRDPVDSILYAKVPGAVKKLVKSYAGLRGLYAGKV